MPENDFVELCEEFFEFETNFDVLNRRICGVYFWERVRFSVHRHLRRSLGEDMDDTSTAGTGSKEYLSGLQLFLRNFVMKNPFLSGETDILFYGTGRRKQFPDGLWWDIYHDPIVESLADGCILWERPYKLTHFTPAKTSNLRYVDLVEYTGTLLQKLGIGTVSFSPDERSFITDIKNEIASRFGVEVPLLSIVREDLSKRRMRLPIYQRLLQRVDPDVAFLTVSYNGRETFIEACRLEGVPVVELQHGAMSRYHMAYSFPDEEKNVFPDYFFSFGDFWSEMVELPLPEDRVQPVGYPYLEKEVGTYDDVEQHQQTLFISQGSIGKELSRFAVRLNDRDSYEQDIVYKLHPREYDSWEDNYPWLKNKDIQVVDSDSPPLYRLFAESTAQVGVGSTAVYEGLYFDLDTYVLDIPSETHKLDPLIDKGYAELINSPDELLDRSKAGGDRRFDVEAIFKSNAIANIANAVDEIRAKQE
jgi:hypothetical protein